MEKINVKILVFICIGLLLIGFMQNCNNRNILKSIDKKIDSLYSISYNHTKHIDTLSKNIYYLSKDLETSSLQQLLTNSAINNKNVTIKQLETLIEKNKTKDANR